MDTFAAQPGTLLKFVLCAGMGVLWAFSDVPRSAPSAMVTPGSECAGLLPHVLEQSAVDKSLIAGGPEQFEWPGRVLGDRPDSLPIIAFTRIPLASAYPDRRWGTNLAAQALADRRDRSRLPG